MYKKNTGNLIIWLVYIGTENKYLVLTVNTSVNLDLFL